jgi:ADP-heptose:LPS heptosyltransferase
MVGTPALVPPRLVVPPAADRAGKRLLEVHGVTPECPFVAVHPGSRGSAAHWPEAHYTELATALRGAGMQVVVTGIAEETDRCRRVAGESGVSLAGRTDLPTLGSILSRACLLVVGSTGPMHLAAALGTPVVAIFSPLPSQAPDRWGPLGDRHTVIQPAPGHEKDPDAAMAGITPQTVTSAALATARSWEPTA